MFMLKVIIEEVFYQKLSKFFTSYKNVFKSLYSDTWIIEEEILYEAYHKTANQMEESVINEIYKKLSEETIFWYKLYEDWQKSVKIFLKSFMLEIFYEEDLDEKIRFIENIKISKK